MGTVVIKNRLPQAVPTLVMDEETQKFKEVRVPPREKLEVPEPLSDLTESQCINGIFKKVAPKS